MPKLRMVSPASAVVPTIWEKIRPLFEKQGYTPTFGNPLTPVRYFAGSVQERTQELHQAFADTETTAVMAIKGGYGTATLLDTLDYRFLKRHKKPFFGISDTTAFQNALYTKTGLVSYTGFAAICLTTHPQTKLFQQLKSALTQKPNTYTASTVTGTGRVQGHLVGGNLSNFVTLLGTPYFPKTRKAILLLEEVSEPPYKVDRMLNQLRLAGVFKNVSGVILGSFYHCQYKGTTMAPVLEEYFKNLGKPVFWHIPYGHSPKDYLILPIGGKVCLNTQTKKISY